MKNKFKDILTRNDKYITNMYSSVVPTLVFLGFFFSISAFWYDLPKILIAPVVIFLTQHYIAKRNVVYDKLKMCENILSESITEICNYIEKEKTECKAEDTLKIHCAKITIKSIQENNAFILYPKKSDFETIIQNLDRIYFIASGDFKKDALEDATSEIRIKYTLIMKSLANIL